MEGMMLYVATKVVRAKPMDQLTFQKTIRNTGPIGLNSDGTGLSGFLVEYPDGYLSWSPSEAFLTSHRLLTPGEWHLVAEQQEIPDVEAGNIILEAQRDIQEAQNTVPGPFADETGG